MREQSLLPGFAKPQRPTDSLFLAIFPDTNAAARIAQLAQRLRAGHGLGGKQLATDRFHLSLSFLGTHCGVPEDIVRAASEVSAAIAASEPPFEVRFDRALSFTGSPNNRPFVMRDNGNNVALMQFHQRLVAALGGDGNVRFSPHITLLYDEQSVAEELVEPVSWRVNEFVLVHSLQGKSHYIQLARWTLHD